MTEINLSDMDEGVIPFLKFGLYDRDNYRNKKAADDALQTDIEYGTIRIPANVTFTGEISGVFESKLGAIMYLKNVSGIKDAVKIVKQVGDGIETAKVGDSVKNVKIPLKPNLRFALRKAKKVKKGDHVEITYLGMQQLTPEYFGHKCEVK